MTLVVETPCLRVVVESAAVMVSCVVLLIVTGLLETVWVAK